MVQTSIEDTGCFTGHSEAQQNFSTSEAKTCWCFPFAEDPTHDGVLQCLLLLRARSSVCFLLLLRAVLALKVSKSVHSTKQDSRCSLQTLSRDPKEHLRCEAAMFAEDRDESTLAKPGSSKGKLGPALLVAVLGIQLCASGVPGRCLMHHRHSSDTPTRHTLNG